MPASSSASSSPHGRELLPLIVIMSRRRGRRSGSAASGGPRRTLNRVTSSVRASHQCANVQLPTDHDTTRHATRHDTQHDTTEAEGFPERTTAGTLSITVTNLRLVKQWVETATVTADACCPATKRGKHSTTRRFA